MLLAYLFLHCISIFAHSNITTHKLIFKDKHTCGLRCCFFIFSLPRVYFLPFFSKFSSLIQVFLFCPAKTLQLLKDTHFFPETPLMNESFLFLCFFHFLYIKCNLHLSVCLSISFFTSIFARNNVQSVSQDIGHELVHSSFCYCISFFTSLHFSICLQQCNHSKSVSQNNAILCSRYWSWISPLIVSFPSFVKYFPSSCYLPIHFFLHFTSFQYLPATM